MDPTKEQIFSHHSGSYYFAKEIPDVRDGLTTLQRAVLSKVKELSPEHAVCSASVVFSFDGMHFSNAFDGKHGFAATLALYSQIINFAQKWRTPRLLEGRGNFGHPDQFYKNIADPQYTEVKFSDYANNIFQLSRKASCSDADSVFKTYVPNAVISGTFGTACNIPSHNLGEVLDTVIALIQNPELPQEQIFDYIQGPDYKTGGVIINKSELPSIYSAGVGNIKFRAKAHIERKNKRTKAECVITEYPFTLIQDAFDASPQFLDCDDDFIKSVMADFDVFDFYTNGAAYLSDLCKDVFSKIHIPLKSTANEEEFFQYLFTMTKLEGNYEYRSILLSNGKPKLMSFYEILSEWLAHYREITTKDNHGKPLTDDQLCEKLEKIKKRFATPRKTKIIDG